MGGGRGQRKFEMACTAGGISSDLLSVSGLCSRRDLLWTCWDITVEDDEQE